MDTSDPGIVFDAAGVCNHCRAYEASIRSPAYLSRRAPGALDALVADIKARGAGKDYDCLIGVSGGVDSTYLAYVAKKLGLRPLAVHLDNGWDSDLAVTNIQRTLEKLGIDLTTRVLDWDEFKDLQLAFLKGSTPDAEVPTDHAIAATMHALAVKHKIAYVLTGTNTATEGGGAASWSQGHGDWKYIRSVHKKWGTRARLRDFPHYTPWKLAYWRHVRRIQWVPILDYVEYDKKKAVEILKSELGWREYEGKHCESIYTRFYQEYYLRRKFSFNKKREHLSSLVWSGQLTREEALREMDVEAYPEEKAQEDAEYVRKKLGLTREAFDAILAAPPKSFWDYPSYKRSLGKYTFLRAAYQRVRAP